MWGEIVRMEDSKGNVKYAQQHLANERTYLAWIRTAISIIGVGFLATSLHFAIGKDRSQFIDLIAIILGILACVLGIFITLMATLNYIHKGKNINEGIFVSSNKLIVIVSVCIFFLIIVIVGYFVVLSFFPAARS